MDWEKTQKKAWRAARRALARVKTPEVALVWHPDYEAPEHSIVDPKRGARIVQYLIREGGLRPSEVLQPGLASVEALARVHTFEYLESLGRGDVVGRMFGEQAFSSPQVERLLRQQRRMVEGTVLAARAAVRPWGLAKPAINVGGGLHHARRAQGAGFCALHDVAVAIAQLRADGFRGRILVVDLDLHDGDGTRSIFAQDPTVFTFSIHAADWDAAPAVANLSVPLGSGIGDAAYLDALRRHLPPVMRDFDPALVFYVAGVDVAEDDRLGSWRVTHDGIFERDRFVLEQLGPRPWVWVLAGGYGPDAWRHSARSLAWVATQGLPGPRGLPIRSALEEDLGELRRVARALQPHDLTTDPEEIELTAQDVFGLFLGDDRPSDRFLGYYSRYGVEIALERYGVFPKIRQLGFDRVALDLDPGHSTGHLARIVTDDARRDVLVEVVLRESQALPPFSLLSIEWLLLQNPRQAPTPARPLLPGQQHPGLGCLREVMGMILMACERLKLDGVIFRPAHFHVAAMARAWLRFLDPQLEGRWLAASHAMEGLDIATASRLVQAGRVLDPATGEAYRWESDWMVLPISAPFQAHMASPAIQAEIERASQAVRFGIAPDPQG
jgi:acetoin utilization deacetylase AcuC-like enzyme